MQPEPRNVQGKVRLMTPSDMHALVVLDYRLYHNLALMSHFDWDMLRAEGSVAMYRFIPVQWPVPL